MKPKFRKGDIIFWKASPEKKYQIIDIIEKSEKRIKGDWINGSEELLVDPNCYILKDLENNKLTWEHIYIEDHYQLLQPIEEKSLKWKNYEEILV